MDTQVNTIRRLNRYDFANFYPLFETLVKSEIPEIIKQHKFFLEGDFSRERVYSSLDYPQIAIFGYFQNGENDKEGNLLGFIWGNNGYAGLGFVSWLMVDKNFRNNGIGKTLLIYYEDYIKKEGGHVIELYCFEAMKDYYLKNKYEIIGMRPKGYFGLKQYILDKILVTK